MRTDDTTGGFHVLRMRTLANAGLTGGAFELVEDVRAAGQGPAPHVHKRSDEAFYVLAGRFAFTRGDQELEATPGSLVFIPKGTRHRYRALEDESRLLILYVPAGGFDDFLRELGWPVAGRSHQRAGDGHAEGKARLRPCVIQMAGCRGHFSNRPV